MTDTTTKKLIRVLPGGTAGPYIIVAVSQLDDLRRILDSRGIRYWVSEHAISINGGPEKIGVNFGRQGNEAAIQAILDLAL